MRKTFKYRLKPTRHQRTVLNKTLEVCRWVYNETLSVRKRAWDENKASLSLNSTIKMLPEWKSQKPELTGVYSQVLQNVCSRVDLAFQSFFRRVKAGEKPGYPRFKGDGRYDSFTYTQSGFKLLDNNYLSLSKIGSIKVVKHRPVDGKIKTLTIVRDAIGNWYACFSCEVSGTPLMHSEKAVGIDVGLNSYATLSNGEKIANPRFFRRDEKDLARSQRKSSHRAVAHIHERIKNRRTDFAHKLSRRLVDEYGIIAFEKLNIQRMLKNHRLAKSISDASWNQFLQYSVNKAEEAGRVVVLVDPKGTSQRCSRCGDVVKKSLSVRTHSCHVCGLVIDRDENAAINILALGLKSLGKIPKSHSLI